MCISQKVVKEDFGITNSVDLFIKVLMSCLGN